MNPKESVSEATLALHLRADKHAGWVREHQFHDVRKFRFDFAFPKLKIGIEVEGGTTMNGRHNRAEGYENDCEKYNLAQASGWSVYRYTSAMVKSGAAIAQINEVISNAIQIQDLTNKAKDLPESVRHPSELIARQKECLDCY